VTASQEDRAEEAVGRSLAAQGVRLTSGRRRVVRCLATARGPRSAGDLHLALGTQLPLSSLYRTLAVLEAAQALAKEHDGNGVARYELAEWILGHHHHLMCTACGEVRDVAIDYRTEASIGRLVHGLADRAGYQATGHRVDIEGICARCRNA
jgi:Fur family transcriptional regulator, ferric uptake regulator